MNQILDGARIILCLIFLVYASWSDYKSREVSNKVWAVFGPLALLLTGVQIIFFSPQPFQMVTFYVLSFAITSGLAITIFYVLLISISEHVNFDMAYLISGIAVITLISGYGKSVLKNGKLAAMISGILFVLYTYLYILLQLEDYALLMGSIGLFVVLSIMMYMTRKIEWYDIRFEGKGGKGKADCPPPIPE